MPCFFTSCEVDLTGFTAERVREHLQQYHQLGQVIRGQSRVAVACPFDDCDIPDFNNGYTPDDIEYHFKYHISLICGWPGCKHKFTTKPTDKAKRAHMSTHVPFGCPWDSCNHVFGPTDTNEARRNHLSTHVNKDPKPAPKPGPKTGLKLGEGDQDYVPDEVRNKAGNKDKTLYCPVCWGLVASKKMRPSCQVRKTSTRQT